LPGDDGKRKASMLAHKENLSSIKRGKILLRIRHHDCE
jgi:hypothetical protein